MGRFRGARERRGGRAAPEARGWERVAEGAIGVFPKIPARFSAPGRAARGPPSMLGTLRSGGLRVRAAGEGVVVQAGGLLPEGHELLADDHIHGSRADLSATGNRRSTPGRRLGWRRYRSRAWGGRRLLDSYQCLMHLTAGDNRGDSLPSFSMAAFFQFTLFSVFEMRVLLQIWKSRRPNSEQNWLEIPAGTLSALYSRFYGGFLLGFVIMYWCTNSPWFIALLCNSYWLPQIAWSAWPNAKKPLMPAYVLGTSAIRVLVPLYVFGCPENFVRVKPQFWVCWLLVIWVAAQVAALAAQHVFGPECFIPDKYLPEVYDYHRRVEPEVLASAGAGGDEGCGEAGGVDCVICMNAVDAKTPRERMVTPCNHFFHQECLERWMEVKMECPTCRGGAAPAVTRRRATRTRRVSGRWTMPARYPCNRARTLVSLVSVSSRTSWC